MHVNVLNIGYMKVILVSVTSCENEEVVRHNKMIEEDSDSGGVVNKIFIR